MTTPGKLLLPVTALFFFVTITAFAADEIDWNRARELHRKSQGGGTLTDNEQAYLKRAMEMRNRQQGGGRPSGPVPEAKSETGMIPLTDLGEKYKGEDGGLYGGGKNEPPAELAKAAKAETAKIQPLDAGGKPSAVGKIVLLSIGMSNTTMEFQKFAQLANADADKNPNLVIVDGAQGGQSADRIASESVPFWGIIEDRLKSAGVTAQQVQVVWIKQAIPAPRDGFPAAMKKLKDDIAVDLNIAKKRYPNLRVVYLSSRTYAGYASTPLNPEPYAYESAFAVRWLIQDQLKGAIREPVLLWGPYLWTDGVKGRKAGDLVWKREDCGGDGTHPSESGRQKVAGQLLQFFKSDANARTWFVKTAK